MDDTCTHLDQVDIGAQPSAEDGEDRLREGGRRVHLRISRGCGQVSCYDSSPAKHASARSAGSGRALISAFEPGEAWWWCYLDEVAFIISDQPTFSNP